MASSFSAQVSEFCAQTKVRMKAVRDEAIQRTIAAAQLPKAQGGHMPVDTGFLWNSGWASSDGSLPPLQTHPGSGSYAWDVGPTTLVIAGSKLEDTITFAYGANYAIYQEYGTRFMPGNAFVALAAQQWPQIVEAVCAEVEARYK